MCKKSNIKYGKIDGKIDGVNKDRSQFNEYVQPLFPQSAGRPWDIEGFVRGQVNIYTTHSSLILLEKNIIICDNKFFILLLVIVKI